MVTPAAGEVVLIPFPFSDFSQTKVRPAVCLADAGCGDWMLCQITSNPYGDSAAEPLDTPDFAQAGCWWRASPDRGGCSDPRPGHSPGPGPDPHGPGRPGRVQAMRAG